MNVIDNSKLYPNDWTPSEHETDSWIEVREISLISTDNGVVNQYIFYICIVLKYISVRLLEYVNVGTVGQNIRMLFSGKNQSATMIN